MSVNLPEFIGLDTEYLNAEQRSLCRLHMDGAASPLAAKIALSTISELLPHYSNIHSRVHNSAKISTDAFNWAHQTVLEYFGADQDIYTAVFMGSGSTAAINRVSRGLHMTRPNRPVVLVSAMEHHANDLPHRQFGNDVHHLPLTGNDAEQGAIDLIELEKLLQTFKGRVNYLAFSAVSNVTGIINPVAEITELAHRYDTLVMLDAAQAVAHQNIDISAIDDSQQVDFLIFSGHKFYCPTAPGVLIAKKSLLDDLNGQDFGGGAVQDVSYYDYQLSQLPEREQAGTPNIIGTIALAKVLEQLQHYGQQKVETHALGLANDLAAALRSLPHITVYGSEQTPRIGALAFTHENIDHGLLAAILNDYYLIAVRNECFCAHPYVSSLLQETLWQIDLDGVATSDQEAYINRKRGMVRASLSLYNTVDDVERLIKALVEINRRVDELRPMYESLPDGNYRHRQYRIDWREQLGW